MADKHVFWDNFIEQGTLIPMKLGAIVSTKKSTSQQMTLMSRL